MVRFKANIVNINILQMNVKRQINTYVLPPATTTTLDGKK